MNVAQFIAKWEKTELKESSAAHEHFLDLCRVFEHATPAAADPTGESFTFERGATKHGGGDGWADVWKRGFFGWEYKGKRKDLDAAYDQLLQYKEALENPPLLVVCDMDRIVVHTNFTGTKGELHDIPLSQLDTPRNLEIVRAVFHHPAKLKPGTTSEAITTEAARTIAEIAWALRQRGIDPEPVAHYLDRIVFCLFAEDVGLLPDQLFTRLLEKTRTDPPKFARYVEDLFAAMADGGDFLLQDIRHFNGNLFVPGPILELTPEEIESLYAAARLDWSAVDPSIFGTLFERGMDPAKRSQLGAHYTSRDDIETLVDPVVMQPLLREWRETRDLVENLLATGKKKPTGNEKLPSGARLKKAQNEAQTFLRRFHQRLAQVKVLDPACGSGNFLYVVLQKLKDLEKEVLIYGMDRGFTAFIPLVGPWQLYGIEINRYAFELAQMTVWIGYLQWTRNNGFGHPNDPVLRSMDNFECKDAILDLSDPENPQEPEWPRVDFIVGNPPFLGSRFMRRELGDDYCVQLYRLYQKRMGGRPDLVCYWFEKARHSIEMGRCQRAGLVATQGIRGGTNRRTLRRILKTGSIFFGESDRNWVLDGATVHISMIGFDLGTEVHKVLDGRRVAAINSNLTSGIDITSARNLRASNGLALQGGIKRGSFDWPDSQGLDLLDAGGNPHGQPNSDVLLPYTNAADITGRDQNTWIIHFGSQYGQDAASRYFAPFELVRRHVLPERARARQEEARETWWLHWRSRPRLSEVLKLLPRYIVTPRVSQHRIFTWLSSPRYPDNAIVVFCRADDYFFGVLHSRIHEFWTRAQGTQLRERESGFRYTHTTCFESFAFPWSPGQEPEGDPRVVAIAEAARELNELRETWLNPPEWTKEEVLEFPGSLDGPWQRYLHDPDERGIGTVRYPRIVPRDDEYAAKLKKRTLTHLYNERPTWLDLAHRKLDEAVFTAYGWEPGMKDKDLLEKLLALNLERAEQEAQVAG